MKCDLSEVPRDRKSPERDIVGVARPLDMGSIARIHRAPAGPGPAGRTADLLAFAAAPTFAVMAALAGIPGGGPADPLCAAAHGASAPGGMMPMYLLMSAFHLAPWLRLLARRGGARRSPSGAPQPGGTITRPR